MDEKIKNDVDFEVAEKTLRDDLENTCGSNGGGATSDKRNISTCYAIAAVLAVILFVIAILLFINLK